ncbi:MAG TPA: PEP-CTERM sorting domain-containing protein [Thermodesulfobacteriota bacterium]
MRRAAAAVIGAAVIGLGWAGPARAISIGLHEASEGLSGLGYSISGTTIDLFGSVGSLGTGFIEFTGLGGLRTYTINLHLTNDSGADWAGFGFNLFDASGGLDDLLEGQPPAWVPAGYAPSDLDDLFFVGSGNSDAFGEVSDGGWLSSHDSLAFYDGLLSDGETATFSFGLANIFGSSFLLGTKPTAQVPEPSTLALLGLGAAASAFALRRVRRS